MKVILWTIALWSRKPWLVRTGIFSRYKTCTGICVLFVEEKRQTSVFAQVTEKRAPTRTLQLAREHEGPYTENQLDSSQSTCPPTGRARRRSGLETREALRHRAPEQLCVSMRRRHVLRPATLARAFAARATEPPPRGRRPRHNSSACGAEQSRTTEEIDTPPSLSLSSSRAFSLLQTAEIKQCLRLSLNRPARLASPRIHCATQLPCLKYSQPSHKIIMKAM